MTTSTALYCGEEEDDHLEDYGLGHGHLGPAFLVFFASYRLREDLGLGRDKGVDQSGGHGHPSLLPRNRKSRPPLP